MTPGARASAAIAVLDRVLEGHPVEQVLTNWSRSARYAGSSDRAVVRDGQIVIRPMMYLALSYDHRLIDGREAVTALKIIKEAIEDPTRLLIDL